MLVLSNQVYFKNVQFERKNVSVIYYCNCIRNLHVIKKPSVGMGFSCDRYFDTPPCQRGCGFSGSGSVTNGSDVAAPPADGVVAGSRQQTIPAQSEFSRQKTRSGNELDQPTAFLVIFMPLCMSTFC